MLPRLVLKSWAQVIHPPWPLPKYQHYRREPPCLADSFELSLRYSFNKCQFFSSVTSRSYLLCLRQEVRQGTRSEITVAYPNKRLFLAHIKVLYQMVIPRPRLLPYCGSAVANLCFPTLPYSWESSPRRGKCLQVCERGRHISPTHIPYWLESSHAATFKKKE